MYSFCNRWCYFRQSYAWSGLELRTRIFEAERKREGRLDELTVNSGGEGKERIFEILGMNRLIDCYTETKAGGQQEVALVPLS